MSSNITTGEVDVKVPYKIGISLPTKIPDMSILVYSNMNSSTHQLDWLTVEITLLKENTVVGIDPLADGLEVMKY